MFKKIGENLKTKKYLKEFNASNLRLNKKGIFVLFNPIGLRGKNEISTVIRDLKTPIEKEAADYCLEYVIIGDELQTFTSYDDFSKKHPIIDKLKSFSIEDLLYSNDSFYDNLTDINGLVTENNEKYRLLRDTEYTEDKIKAMINLKESLNDFSTDKKLQKDYVTVLNGVITFG